MTDFTISNLLNESVGKKQIKKIYYEDLIPSENNYFEMSDILTLAENIMDVGLMFNLLVLDNEDGTFTVIAGHRRLKAIKYILENYEDRKEEFEEISCKIIPKNTNPLLVTYMLITSNLTSRGGFAGLSAEEKMETIKRLEELIIKIKEDPSLNLKGKLRDLIANEIGISGQQVQKYKTQMKQEEGKSKPSTKKESEYEDENQTYDQRIKLKYNVKSKTKDTSLTIKFEDRIDLEHFMKEVLKVDSVGYGGYEDE